VIEAKNGKVVSSKYWGYNGTIAIYNSQLNKTFIYWHLAEGSINESLKGKTIAAGSQIGIEGETGTAYGAHTHVEVHEGRKNINMANPNSPQAPPNSGRLDVASIFQDAVRKGLVYL
jgi:murein DD-endopeptidase MepM/ murein hydrolase activator NlpD